MSFYSDFGSRRAAQIAADLGALVVMIAATSLGVALYRVFAGFAELWGSLADAGESFRVTMSEIGENLAAIPFIGAVIESSFDTASGAGVLLSEVGNSGRVIILSFAALAGFGVAALPFAVLVLAWFLPRLRFCVRAKNTRAVLALGEGEKLLALRALSTANAKQLAQVSATPLADWQEGKQGVVRALATITAHRAGVRLPSR